MSTKKNKFTTKDRFFMSLALNYARERAGLTGDNPSVGCVIVKDNEILSIGNTSIDGRPHAEFNAIKNTNKNLKNSTLYVTLEPCSHYGHTPPCTKYIIKKKIKKVIYSVSDIDQRTRKKSEKILKSQKIIVKKGLLIKKISKFYESYYFNRKNKLPYVTGKIAMSKNNLIYTQKQKKITNTLSHKLSHLLRYKNDAILVSKNTLNNDNPLLNCRLNGLEKFSPKKVILDKNLNSNLNLKIFKNKKFNNIIIFYNHASKKKINFFLKKGVKLIKHKLNNKNQFELKNILQRLYLLGCRNLLVEGGKKLTINFLKNKLFNQFYLFKSSNNLSKLQKYKIINPFNCLKKQFKNKLKINTFLKEDIVYLYRN